MHSWNRATDWLRPALERKHNYQPALTMHTPPDWLYGPCTNRFIFLVSFSFIYCLQVFKCFGYLRYRQSWLPVSVLKLSYSRIVSYYRYYRVVHKRCHFYYSSRATFLTYMRTHDDRPTDQRPTDLAFWKISNGHISETVHPVQYVFGSRVKV